MKASVVDCAPDALRRAVRLLVNDALMDAHDP